jgi:hypothetical protein
VASESLRQKLEAFAQCEIAIRQDLSVEEMSLDDLNVAFQKSSKDFLLK